MSESDGVGTITPDYGFVQAMTDVRDNNCLSLMNAVRDWNDQRRCYRIVKRLFDIVFSAFVLLVIIVPGILLAIAIRIESPGCPFYKQKRVGRLNRDGSVSYFTMWKFRSMYKDADQRLGELMSQNEVEGAMFKMHDDPRVTKIGRFIRKHSIDEFPQFLNIFLGQMSVVGPRPPLPNEVDEYTPFDLQRLAVKPGLTGPWQVGGRSDLSFKEMVNLDLRYIVNRGVLTDLRIILATIVVVFTGKGAS